MTLSSFVSCFCRKIKPKIDTNMKKSPRFRKDRSYDADGNPCTGNNSDDDEGFYQKPKKSAPRVEFSEYEIALLWTQYKDNFGSGRVNKIQLAQMLRQVITNTKYYGVFLWINQVSL